MNTPAVIPASLIIASRNRPKLLWDTVQSIFEGSHVPSELIIVDQSDNPDAALASLSAPSGCEVRYEYVNYTGLSRANNAAIQLARNERLVFTHDDVLVDQDWLATIVCSLDTAGPRAVITGKVEIPEPEVPGAFKMPVFNFDDDAAVFEGRVWQDVLYPFNMALHRSTIQALGGFDERLGPGTTFPGAEDNDIGFRLLEAGYRIVYEPRAVLYHRSWRSNYLGMRWTYARAQGAFYAKYLGSCDNYTRQRMQLEIRHRTGRLIHRPIREAKLALGDVVYVAGLLSGAAHWLWRY